MLENTIIDSLKSLTSESVGVDIVEISRFEVILNRTPRFLDRVFTNQEIDNRSVETIAGKFAAKEAVLKCLKKPLFSIPFKDIIILNEESGAPFVKSHPNILVSISHVKDLVIAVAVMKE